MPLDEPIRSDVSNYILKHIVPKGVSPRPRTAMEWFHKLFSFIPDSALREHLAEACYQARFIGRFQEALRLQGKFNRAILKQQIILYASIYEAVIDYYLDRQQAEPPVRDLLIVVELKEVKGIVAKGSLKGTDNGREYEVVTCKRAGKQRKLYDVRFSDRLAAAKTLGLIPTEHVLFIQALYDARNNIHIMRAAAEQFAPDARMSSLAFQKLLVFFRHAERWSRKLSGNAEQPTGASRNGASGEIRS